MLTSDLHIHAHACTYVPEWTHPLTHTHKEKEFVFLNVILSSWYFFVFKKLYATSTKDSVVKRIRLPLLP